MAALVASPPKHSTIPECPPDNLESTASPTKKLPAGKLLTPSPEASSPTQSAYHEPTGRVDRQSEPPGPTRGSADSNTNTKDDTVKTLREALTPLTPIPSLESPPLVPHTEQLLPPIALSSEAVVDEDFEQNGPSQADSSQKMRASTFPISNGHLPRQPSNPPISKPSGHAEAHDSQGAGLRKQSPRRIRKSSTAINSRTVIEPAPPVTLPMPPLSMSAYLQLELSPRPVSSRYIFRPLPVGSEAVFESTKVKINRLLNFLMLPPHLESVLLFGVLACLDAWLYNFTILPLRFVIAVAVLGKWLLANAWKEMLDLGAFLWTGTRRAGERRMRVYGRSRKVNGSAKPAASSGQKEELQEERTLTKKSSSMALNSLASRSSRTSDAKHHRRTRSTPSTLLPNHKGDILRGLLIVSTCMVLMRFDASRMYHTIRGQSAIKLYVIFNVLEVGDRLLSAIGQDIVECLFSSEVLERNSDGRSQVWRPFWMFILAMIYNTVHAIALFYQAITLNVAVNSYSNALLTLLMSNQFVEIKGTVFKRFDKEGLFQMTCADIIERFQLWLMMTIIAMRNVLELGSFFSSTFSPLLSTSIAGPDGVATLTTPPSSRATITPMSFTLLPQWAGQVISPVLVVLGSEMIVDWVKHAYITKFSNTRRDIYGRYLDLLAKDYYTNAFSGASETSTGGGRDITRRLGLPVIPLSCLFIRSVAQTYRMIITTQMPVPVIPSPVSALSFGGDGPTTTAAFSHIDYVFRRALGRSAFGAGEGHDVGNISLPAVLSDIHGLDWLFEIPYRWYLNWNVWELVDDAIALATLCFVVLAFWLLLLALKLTLGIVLLRFSKGRYQRLLSRQRQLEREKEREREKARDRDGREKRESEKTEKAEREGRGRPSRAGNRGLRPIITSGAIPVSEASDASMSVTGPLSAVSTAMAPGRHNPESAVSGPATGISSVPLSAPASAAAANMPSPASATLLTGPPVVANPGPNSLVVGSSINTPRTHSNSESNSVSASAAAGTVANSTSASRHRSLTRQPTVPIPPDSIVRRGGPFGTVQVSDAHRVCFFENDPVGLEKARDRSRRDLVNGSLGLTEAMYVGEETGKDGSASVPVPVSASGTEDRDNERQPVDDDVDGWVGRAAAREEMELVKRLGPVGRYDMVGKRIW